MMGFMLRQEAAEQRWLLTQCSTGPAMEWSSCQSPGSQSNGASGTTALGSLIQKKLCTKQGEAKLGKPTAKLGVTAGNEAGGKQQSPRARTRAG